MSDSYLKSSLSIISNRFLAYIDLREKKINILNLKNGKVIKKINCVSQKKCVECIISFEGANKKNKK
jgi:hypothetical protein